MLGTLKHAGTVIGFDYSLQRIGVAIASTLTRQARALQTLHNPAGGGVEWAALTTLFEQWKPVAVVVGLPLTAEGAEQETTRAARRFGQRIHGRYGLAVYWQDERYTTQLAKDELAAQGVRRANQDIDATAARIILQSWLDNVAQQTPNGVQ